MITLETVQKHLGYNPETGEVWWKTKRKGRNLKPGRIDADGYLEILIEGYRHKAHRFIWLLTYGKFPDGIIDHINGDRLDNCIKNLRDVNRSQNSQNMRGAHKDSETGLLGVSKSRIKGKYRSRIHVEGKEMSLGHFDTPEEAHAAYLAAKKKYHIDQVTSSPA